MAAACTFKPTPDQAARLMADFDSPDLSFRELAARHGTNSEALAVWLNTVAVRERVETNLEAVASRTRAVAVNLLPCSLAALAHVLDNYKRDQAALAQPGTGASQTAPTSVCDPGVIDRQRRRDETTRRAAYLIFRLATFFPLLRAPIPRALAASAPAAPHPDRAAHPASPAPAPSDRAVARAPTSAPIPSAPSARTHPAPISQPPKNGASSTPAPAPSVNDLALDSIAALLAPAPPFDAVNPLTRKPKPSALLTRAGACVGAAP